MLTVKDIMTRPVVVIRNTASVASAIWLMRVKKVRSLIVEKTYKGSPTGTLTERDIVYNVIAKGDNSGFVLVGDVMTRPAFNFRSMPHCKMRHCLAGTRRHGVNKQWVFCL